MYAQVSGVVLVVTPFPTDNFGKFNKLLPISVVLCAKVYRMLA